MWNLIQSNSEKQGVEEGGYQGLGKGDMGRCCPKRYKV
jgi:hypothetical protein